MLVPFSLLRNIAIDSYLFLRSQKQHNGCDNGIPDDFIFKEARKIPRHFTYTHNAKCLGTNIDGTLSLMNVNDKRCRYRLFKWT